MSQRSEYDVLDRRPLEVTAGYIMTSALMLAVLGFLWFVARDWMVMSFDQLWKPDANVDEGLGRVWFIFLWGAVGTLIIGVIGLDDGKYREHGPGETFFKGLWISINAGVFEELIFRWMIFFSAMVTLRFLNAITFGLVEWCFSVALNPLANWATFDALEPQLLGASWLLGAAVVSANAEFRDEHKYLGLIGYINSWFLGMVFFWLMFNYGLWTAIVAHVLYDICVFTARALVATFQPKNDYEFARYVHTDRY